MSRLEDGPSEAEFYIAPSTVADQNVLEETIWTQLHVLPVHQMLRKKGGVCPERKRSNVEKEVEIALGFSGQPEHTSQSS
ncbi:hypothetical protein Tco_1129763 [Tanacetum coccineum]